LFAGQCGEGGREGGASERAREIAVRLSYCLLSLRACRVNERSGGDKCAC